MGSLINRVERVDMTGAGILWMASAAMVGLKLWWGVDLTWGQALAPALLFLAIPVAILALALALIVIAVLIAVAIAAVILAFALFFVGIFLMAPTWKVWGDMKNAARRPTGS